MMAAGSIPGSLNEALRDTLNSAEKSELTEEAAKKLQLEINSQEKLEAFTSFIFTKVRCLSAS